MSFNHLTTFMLAGSGTTIAYTLGSGESIPAGSTIHVAAVSQNQTAPSCSDSVNGAYTKDAEQLTGVTPAVQASMYRFSNNAALTTGDIITVTLGATSFNRLMGIGWSDDLDLASPLDQAATTGSDTSANNTQPSTGGQTLNNANVRWIGVIGIGDNTIASFSEDAQFTNIAAVDAANKAMAWGRRDVTATETNDYNPTIAASQSWKDLLVAYKMAAAGGPALRTFLLLGVGS